MSAILIRMFTGKTPEELQAKMQSSDDTGLKIIDSKLIQTPSMLYFFAEVEEKFAE